MLKTCIYIRNNNIVTETKKAKSGRPHGFTEENPRAFLLFQVGDLYVT